MTNVSIPREVVERPKFEEWHKRQMGGPVSYRRDSNGDYENMDVEVQWWAWLARASLAASHSPAPAVPDAHERELLQLIDERDLREEVINKLCDAVLGPDRQEWSSAYGFEDAVLEVEERITQLHQPSIDKAWARFEKAAKPEPKLCDLPPHLDVRRIMLKAVPDGDGDPIEVYAKSIDDVEEEMSRMGQRLEEYELGIRRYSDPAAKPETQGERQRLIKALRDMRDIDFDDVFVKAANMLDMDTGWKRAAEAATPLSAGPARVEPLDEHRIMDMAKMAGFNLDPTANYLYTVRGNSAQVINLIRLCEAAHHIGKPKGVGINGLTESETAASASVMGLRKDA